MTRISIRTMFDCGYIKITRPAIIKMNRSDIRSIRTLNGIRGRSRKIISGRVIKIATKSYPMSEDDTTIGIGLINSPMIPLPKIRGINAQTVVIVVVKITTLKSRKTKSPVSSGENLLVLK